MNKRIMIVLALLLALTLTSCGTDTKKEAVSAPEAAVSESTSSTEVESAEEETAGFEDVSDEAEEEVPDLG